MVKGVESDEERKDLIVSWWSALDDYEIFVLNKILTGAFRVGASEKLVIKGLAAAVEVPEAVLNPSLNGEFEPTVEFYQRLTSQAATKQPRAKPYPFFLASAPSTQKSFKPKMFPAGWRSGSGRHSRPGD